LRRGIHERERINTTMDIKEGKEREKKTDELLPSITELIHNIRNTDTGEYGH
jgi:hypothetical protein